MNNILFYYITPKNSCLIAEVKLNPYITHDTQYSRSKDPNQISLFA